MVKKKDKEKKDGTRDLADKIDMAADLSGFMPGAIGDTAAAPLKGISGKMTGRRDYEDYSKALGRDLASGATGNNRALKRSVKEMTGRGAANFEKYGSISAGAIAGQAVGSVMLPIPIVGTLGGAWLGSNIASGIYNEAVKTQDQDAVGLVVQLRRMQQQGQIIPPELVFAALAMNLPDKKEAQLEKRLERLTGTKKFSEAVEQGQISALTQLMKEFDTDIRVDLHENTMVPYDPSNPDKTASEQLAEKFNSQEWDAGVLLFRNEIPAVVTIRNQQTSVTGQPARARMDIQNPEIAGIAADLNQLGVTPAIGEDGQLVLLPNNNKLTPGKA